jgi:hypothetical protein
MELTPPKEYTLPNQPLYSHFFGGVSSGFDLQFGATGTVMDLFEHRAAKLAD